MSRQWFVSLRFLLDWVPELHKLNPQKTVRANLIPYIGFSYVASPTAFVATVLIDTGAILSLDFRESQCSHQCKVMMMVLLLAAFCCTCMLRTSHTHTLSLYIYIHTRNRFNFAPHTNDHDHHSGHGRRGFGPK